MESLSFCHRRAVFALVPRFQCSSSRSVLTSLRISFLDARLSHWQPRFQWTLSRSLPTTGFYDSVDSGQVRHCSWFLFRLEFILGFWQVARIINNAIIFTFPICSWWMYIVLNHYWIHPMALHRLRPATFNGKKEAIGPNIITHSSRSRELKKHLQRVPSSTSSCWDREESR